MEIRVLGPVAVELGGQPLGLGGPKQRAVLALLALNANATVSVDRLIEGLWGEQHPPTAAKMVQLYVSRLRKLLVDDDGAEILTHGRGYELRVERDAVDAARFERLVEEAVGAAGNGGAATAARAALALWHGPPLADLADEPFVAAEARRLEELRSAAQELLLESELASGRHLELIGRLEVLVVEDPLRERFHALRMLALYRAGRQAEALEAYRAARQGLVDEIGVEPGPDLRRLHDAILRQDSALDLEPRELAPELSTTSPALVGRRTELEALRSAWRDVRQGTGRVVMLSGARGIGKTRLVAALALELHAQGVRSVYVGGAEAEAGGGSVVPRDPAGELDRARRLADPGLLVLDDLDRASVGVARDAVGVIADARRRSLLVVVTYRDDAPTEAIDRLTDGRDAETLALGPLGADGVRGIAEGFVGGPAESAPVDLILRVSGGVPQRIHELVADWAGRESAKRVGEAAGRTAARRGELRELESELASGVVGLQSVRERAERVLPAPKGEPLTHLEDGQPVCPFKGLASFQAADADYFFGRERLVAQMVARLVGASLVGVVGPSGSGKSSAVRAGLLPALANGVLPGSGGWTRVVLRPGEHPLVNLAEALATGADGPIEGALARLAPEAKLLLVVDQFEETFTACRDATERAAFIDALTDAAQRRAGRVTIVLALRADYYGACAAHPHLSRLLGESHVLVGPMQPGELAQAIVGPAGRAGLDVEPGLVDRLVADVAGQAGALPLLSTALLELWEHREGRRMRLAAYERTGGVRGAVARLAERAYASFSSDDQGRTRRIMLRLAGSGEQDAVVRRRVPISELGGEEEDLRVLTVLAESRLVTLGEGTAEVAHEALLREWPRLRGWLEEDVEGRRLHRRLTDATRDWERGGRDPGELFRGARLASALDWATDRGDELNRAEREYLEESRLVSEREAERGRRINRRLRGLLAGAAVALAVALAAGLLALDQRGDARTAAVTADAQRLGAEAVTAEPLENALRLARTGIGLDESVATRSSLLTVLQRHPAQLGTLPASEGRTLWAAQLSPDGRLVAAVGEREDVLVYDSASRRPVGGERFRAPAGSVISNVAFSPDNSTLAVAENPDLAIHLIDPRTGRRSHRVVLPPYRGRFPVVPELAFLPGGRDLVVEQTDGSSLDAPASRLLRIDVATGKLAGPSLRVGRRAARGLSVTADGRVFVTVARDDASYEIDPLRMRVLRRHPVGDAQGTVSRDGRRFALASERGDLRVLDLGSGRVRRMGRHGAPLTGLGFTPDGGTLLSGGEDGNVVVWDVDSGERRETFSGHDPGGVNFATDGRTLYSVGREDTRAIVWDLAGDRRLARPFDAGEPWVTDPLDPFPLELAMSPDGGTLARTHDDGSVEVIDTRTLRRRGRRRAMRDFAYAVDFSPDGRLLAVSGEGGDVKLLDARTLRPSGRQLPRGRTDSQTVAFSPDGSLLAVGENGTLDEDISDYVGGSVQIWDVRRRRRGVRVDHGSHQVTFSPDGRLLALAGGKRPTEIRDARNGALVAKLPTVDLGRSIAFSPDGKLVVTGDFAGLGQIWSTKTWKPVGRPLDVHKARILTLGFTRDGRTLVTGGADGTVVLWDVATRTPIGSPLTLGTDRWVSAELTPNGSHLFAVSDQGRGVRLDLDPEAWKRHACRVAGRDLTAREWADALPGRAHRSVCSSG